MKILFVCPPFGALRGFLTTPSTNQGLLYLAGYLREKDADCKVVISDILCSLKRKVYVSNRALTKNWDLYKAYVSGALPHPIWSKISDIVKAYSPDLVCVTSTTPAIDSANKVARVVKSVRSDIPVLFGGPHATCKPESVLENECVDFVIRGEGELPLAAFVEALAASKPSWKNVPSLSYRTDDGHIVHNKEALQIEDLDALPMPARDLVVSPSNSYVQTEHCITGSRGCPYNCRFCADKTLWHCTRQRSVESIVSEIERIVSDFPRTEEIYFTDGTLTYNKRFLTALCSEMIRRKLKLRFFCTARFDNIDFEMLKQMKAAGFVMLYLGAESGDPEVLGKMNKRVTPEIIEEKLMLVRASGIFSLVSILVGVPGETEKSLKNTISLMKRIKADSFDVNSFIPLPGSEWHEELPSHLRDRVDWLEFGVKRKYPYLFHFENKSHLKRYIDEIYAIADSRMIASLTRIYVSRLISLFKRMLTNSV